MTCRSLRCLLWGWCEGAGVRLGKCHTCPDIRVAQAAEGCLRVPGPSEWGTEVDELASPSQLLWAPVF